MRILRIPSENPLRHPEDWEGALDAVPAPVLLVDPDGAIRYTNEEAARLTGYRRDDLRCMGVEALVPEALRDVHARWRTRGQVRSRPMGGTGLSIDCQRPDGSTFPADVSLAPVTIEGVTYVVATLRDETDRKRSEEELLRRALHDPLTGLPNRVLFLDRLGQALARTGRQGRRLAVLYLDLDGFKDVNDTWGHAVGDEVLQVVGQRLAAAVRPGDTVARFGGDEFLVLCEDLNGRDEAVEVSRRLSDALTAPVVHRRGTVSVSASVGVVTTGGQAATPAELVDAADRAMYRAKRTGRAAMAVAAGLNARRARPPQPPGRPLTARAGATVSATIRGRSEVLVGRTSIRWPYRHSR